MIYLVIAALTFYLFSGLIGYVVATVKGLVMIAGVRWLLGGILTLLTLLSLAYAHVYRGFGLQADIIRRGASDRPWVAITFDDGPSAKYTPEILDILAEHDVKATFFVTGANVERHPQIIERMVSEGHSLGNHTYDHVNVPSTSAAKLSAQIIKTQLAILDASGQYPQYMRPPRGMYDGRLRRLSELLGMQLVLWSLTSQDWRPGMSADRVKDRVLNKVSPGDIILFHDSGALVAGEADRNATVKALPGIIEGLQAKGYQIVPLQEFLPME